MTFRDRKRIRRRLATWRTPGIPATLKHDSAHSVSWQCLSLSHETKASWRITKNMLQKRERGS